MLWLRMWLLVELSLVVSLVLVVDIVMVGCISGANSEGDWFVLKFFMFRGFTLVSGDMGMDRRREKTTCFWKKQHCFKDCQLSNL